MRGAGGSFGIATITVQTFAAPPTATIFLLQLTFHCLRSRPSLWRLPIICSLCEPPTRIRRRDRLHARRCRRQRQYVPRCSRSLIRCLPLGAVNFDTGEHLHSAVNPAGGLWIRRVRWMGRTRFMRKSLMTPEKQPMNEKGLLGFMNSLANEGFTRLW
jgi:hypothetical protein